MCSSWWRRVCREGSCADGALPTDPLRLMDDQLESAHLLYPNCQATWSKGVDVILDNVGGPYFRKNLDSLSIDGRLFIVGFMGGVVTQVCLSCLLARRLTVQAAGLKSRTPEKKAEIVHEVEKNVWPAIEAGKVKPVVYKSIPLSEAAEAHKLMESSEHIGKILLIP
ncbi:uncharacterized protein A4U43_C08F27210, partial [Asparagus officinalis]